MSLQVPMTQFREFQQVRAEQKKVLAGASARAKEVQVAGAACSRQAQLIEELQGRIQQASQRPKAELQLELGREQQKHAILVERTEQLDLVTRRGQSAEKGAKASPADVAQLASEVRDRTQHVVELLAEIDQLQRAAAPRKSPPRPASAPRVDLLDEAREAMVSAQLRYEEMDRKRSVIENEMLRRQGEAWGQGLAALHAELSRKSAQLSLAVWYINPEANCEGYDGKMLTFVKIAHDGLKKAVIKENKKPKQGLKHLWLQLAYFYTRFFN
ncbi:unnamed protein product [Symbiodinium natans]|uniref:Uncharacterized protein n=1 Tax=Symbiodinium natans TaxID=878477 RepID=A0A812Q1Y3_9DINO|nr:unnamed protein product [Symbiodinium natans]